MEECAGVEGGVVLDPLLYRIGPQGTVSGMLQCKTMYLTLPPVPQAAWLWCRNGEWIEGGKKEPLPDWGFRIDLAPVDLDALRAGLPELFYSQSVKPSGVDETVEASSGGTVPPPELLRARLNALLEKDPGGYRIVKMSAASALELREIEIEEGSPGDPTARYIAARAFPRFDLQGKTVELILERGSVDRKGKRSTIPSSGFRLHFPGVTPSSWKAAGGPSPR